MLRLASRLVYASVSLSGSRSAYALVFLSEFPLVFRSVCESESQLA